VAGLLSKPTTAPGPRRDGLIKKALCYSPGWGDIDFAVPMFDEFMKRWIPHFDPQSAGWSLALLAVYTRIPIKEHPGRGGLVWIVECNSAAPAAVAVPPGIYPGPGDLSAGAAWMHWGCGARRRDRTCSATAGVRSRPGGAQRRRHRGRQRHSTWAPDGQLASATPLKAGASCHPCAITRPSRPK